MKRLNKIMIILLMLCLMVSCRMNGRERVYTINDPVNSEKRYFNINKITQKSSLEISGKNYTPEQDHVFYVIDTTIMSIYTEIFIINLNDTRFSCELLEDNAYTLK